MTQGEFVHASAVVWKEMGILILGESGSGKSSLAAELITRGARLIADDQVRLVHEGGQMVAKAPEALAGVLELRGLALIHLPYVPNHPIDFIITLPSSQSRSLNSVSNTAQHNLYIQALQEERVLPEDWMPCVQSC